MRIRGNHLKQAPPSANPLDPGEEALRGDVRSPEPSGRARPDAASMAVAPARAQGAAGVKDYGVDPGIRCQAQGDGGLVEDLCAPEGGGPRTTV